jgi:2-phospho-L-lactate/phosphoenolpyruvate guanylyltransferase
MTSDNTRPDDAWTIIIPVKDIRVAKTRLSAPSQPARAALALAFALDAATAALASPVVQRVVVVTNDALAGPQLAELGAQVIADLADAGQNAALLTGVAYARRHDAGVAVAAMSGDLPALRSDDLSTALEAAASLPRWFVADAEGLGTTLLAARGDVALRPSFGPRSSQEHTLSGAAELSVDGLERLRRDVDTIEQLWQAVRLGVGTHTRRALHDLDLDLDLELRVTGTA